MNVQYLIFYPFFFYYFHAWLGVFSENLMEMEGRKEKSHCKYMSRIPMDVWWIS